MQPSDFKRGFQSTGTCDGFGTAAAAGRLLFRGKDAERRIAEAMGLAGGYAGGVAQFYYSGASAKRIQAAHSAESGVAAALLAEQGYSGPTDIIEGAGGFARAYADSWNPAAIEDGLGQRFHLMDVLVKAHAAAARIAAGIDGMLALRQEHGFSGDDIAGMVLGIPRIIQGRLTNPHPVDLAGGADVTCPSRRARLEDRTVARPRPDHRVTDFEAGLSDRSLHAIEERTTITLDDEVEAASSELSNELAARQRDAARWTQTLQARAGAKGQPVTAVHRRGARGALHSGAFEPRADKGLFRDRCNVAKSRSARSEVARTRSEPKGCLKCALTCLDAVQAWTNPLRLANPEVIPRQRVES